MKQLSLLAVAIAVTLIGCENFSKRVNEHIDSGVMDAKIEMSKNVSEAKTAFHDTYNKAINSVTDSTIKNQLRSYNSSVIDVTNYIDSLSTAMNKLDHKDVKNVEVVKNIFLYDGIGDSLFNKVNLSYMLLDNITLVASKSALTNSRNNMLSNGDVNKFKELYFGLNGPLGVVMILNGMETEVLKSGTQSLKDFVNSTTSNK